MRRSPCLTALLLLAACDGSAPSSPADAGAGDGPAPVGDLIMELARAACVAISRCGEGDLVEMRSFAGTGEQCARRMQPRLAVGFRTELALAAAGRARVDQAALERCLETIRTTCTRVQVLFGGGDCGRLFAGAIAEGGGCSDTLECADGGWCEVAVEASDGCGRCRPARPLGSPCNLDQQCSRAEAPAGAVCSQAAGFRCSRLQIAPEAAIDEPCGGVNAAGVITLAACAPPLWCDIADDGRGGTCRAPVSPGAACEQGRSVCGDGHICSSSSSAGSSCQPHHIADQPGEPCDEATGSPACNHYLGLSCAGGTCRKLGQIGEACSGDGNCDFGLFCDQQAQLCQAPRPEGSRCDNDSDCIDERCALAPGASSGLCQARVCG